MNQPFTLPGIPSDLLTSDRFDVRRLKVDASQSATGFGDLIADAWGVQKVR